MMDISMTIIRDWFADNVWVILTVCSIMDLIISIRLLAFGVSYYASIKLEQFSEALPIPKDVWLGFGISTFMACASITLAILRQSLTVLTVISALIIDTSVIGMTYGSIFYPVRAHAVGTRIIRESFSKTRDEKEDK